jgi:putative heme-binding domain-containing protein
LIPPLAEQRIARLNRTVISVPQCSRTLLLVFCLAMPIAGWAAAQEDRKLELLGRLIRDESPKVRLEALRSLAKVRNAKAAELALSAVERPMDATLDYALWLTINDLAEYWIEALKAGTWKVEGHEKELEFALKALPADKAGAVLSRVMADHPLARDGSGPWIEAIGKAGSVDQLRMLLDKALSDGFDEKATVRALNSLGEAYRLRRIRPSGDVSGLAKLFGSSAVESVRLNALRLAGQWKEVGGWLTPVAAIAGDPTVSNELRFAAFDVLGSLGGKDAADSIKGLIASPNPSIRREAVIALSSVDLSRAIPGIVDQVKTIDDESVALEFWRGILKSKGVARQIVDALPEKGLSPVAARVGMRVAREGGRSELDLVLALAKGAGLTVGAGTATDSMIRELASAAISKGDPQRGEMVFRRSDLACVVCHAIGGAGGKVGPDMTSIGASAPVDYLVESVLLPNAKIKEGYHAVLITTKDGTDYAGTLARETQSDVVLRTASGAEQSIAKSEIARREQGTTSLMPAGLLEPLSETEQLDLFSFLSRLGKPGDYDASKGGVARRWRVTLTVHTDAQAGREFWPITTGFDDGRWKPTYSLVRGTLTKPIIDSLTHADVWTSVRGIYAATEISTAAAGIVHFKLTAGPGAELWVAGAKVPGNGAFEVSLPAGIHRVVVQLDPKKVPSELRLEASEGAFVLN